MKIILEIDVEHVEGSERAARFIGQHLAAGLRQGELPADPVGHIWPGNSHYRIVDVQVKQR